ncbi:D-Ala-D-Ala carboxypeptidase family metallohydrolase [Phenylobacterium sp.]|uniref:D-Ala-D-Ala carboxypeptidase family metallohydrolase n=1 Tax=Phenylobacterium sp. TaxID=1871053 RepID=UPI0027310E74|nr:D-Ala-D-Ala carboxypeptidase family metallohydrolase [Phenylobacterium sp.]MDP2214990.1 D-Ala-D-Ala carboxypeptidase family metallohydrolase [Phenylobacterium sp.]
MQLSPHFHLSEFTVSQEAARRGIDNTPPAVLIPRLKLTAQHLELARTILGGHPIILTSGYRCDELNTAINGSRTSAHMRGDAADFICPRFGSPLAICRALAVQKDLPFDQLIEEGTWVHLGFAREGMRPRRQVLTKRPGSGYQTGLAAA